MNAEINLTKEITKKIFFRILPIPVFFYTILIKPFPRNGYEFIKNPTINSGINLELNKIENVNKIALRKKIINDLKFHSSSIRGTKKNITKVILNKEGKIMGYKFYNLYYPNYFTTIQSNSAITKTSPFKKSINLFLIIFKYN